MWKGVTPQLPVVDVGRAQAWYRERGAEIVEPLESKPWGMREFSIRDLDGHFLRFGRGEKDIDEIPEFTVPH